MPTVHLGEYVRSATRGRVADTPYGDLADDLSACLAQWPHLHHKALTRVGHDRIHPSAYIHPSAIIGDDVIIGPGVRIHEFSTVRRGAVLAAGVSIGFNCEVTTACIGEDSVLGHRVGVNSTIVGAEAHLSAGVTAAAINLCDDMRTPNREVVFRTEAGLYRCGTTRFGALVGDGVQTGNAISLGPGAVIGRRCRIDSGVVLAARVIPADHAVGNPNASEVRVRRRRSVRR